MKKSFIFLISLSAIIFQYPPDIYAQYKKNALMFQKDCVLLYEVNFDNRLYMFNVRIIENSRKELTFDWFMTEQPGMTGVVKVQAQGLQSATSYLNYFDFKSDYSLIDQSCVWLSRDIFQKLKNGEKVTLDLGKGLLADFLLVREKTNYIVPVSSRYGDILGLSAIRIESPDGKYFFYVLDNPENPVILYMDLDSWFVKLIGIM